MDVNVVNYNKIINIDHEFEIEFQDINSDEILILINNDIVYSYGDINENYEIDINQNNNNLFFKIKKKSTFEYLEKIKLIIDVKFKIFKTYDYITLDNSAPILYDLNIQNGQVIDVKPYIFFSLKENPNESGIDINTLNVYIKDIDNNLIYYINNGQYNNNECKIEKDNNIYNIKIFPFYPLNISQKYELYIEVSDYNNNKLEYSTVFYTTDNISPKILLINPQKDSIIKNDDFNIVLSIQDKDVHVGSGVNLNKLNIIVNDFEFVVNGIHNNEYINYEYYYIQEINGYQIIITPKIKLVGFDFVKLYVSVEDNAGNISKEIFQFKIEDFWLRIKEIHPINNLTINNENKKIIFTLISNDISLIQLNKINVKLNDVYIIQDGILLDSNCQFIVRKINNNAIDFIIDNVQFINGDNLIKIEIFDFFNNKHQKDIIFVFDSKQKLDVAAFPSGCIYNNNILINLVSNSDADIYYALNSDQFIKYTHPIILTKKDNINILKFYAVNNGNYTDIKEEKYVYSDSVEEKVISKDGLINSDIYLKVKTNNVNINNNKLVMLGENNNYKYFYDFGRYVYIDSIDFNALSSRFKVKLYDDNYIEKQKPSIIDLINDQNIIRNDINYRKDLNAIYFNSNGIDGSFVCNFPFTINNARISFNVLFDNLQLSVYNKFCLMFYDNYNNKLTIEKIYSINNNDINILHNSDGYITINDVYYDNIEKIVDGYQLLDEIIYSDEYEEINLNFIQEYDYSDDFIINDENYYLEIKEYNESVYNNLKYNDSIYSSAKYGYVKYFEENGKYYIPIDSDMIQLNRFTIKSYNYNNNKKKYIYEDSNDIYNVLHDNLLYVNSEENNLISIVNNYEETKINKIVIKTKNNINDRIRCRIKINNVLISKYDTESNLEFINTHDFYLQENNIITLKKDYYIGKIEIITILDRYNKARKIDKIMLYGNKENRNVVNYEITNINNVKKLIKYNDDNVKTKILKSKPLSLDIISIINATDLDSGYNYIIKEDSNTIKLIRKLDYSQTKIYIKPILITEYEDKYILKVILNYDINLTKNAWIYYPTLDKQIRVIDYFITNEQYNNDKIDIVNLIIEKNMYLYDDMYAILIPSLYEYDCVDYIYNKLNKTIYFINESKNSSGLLNLRFLKNINVIKHPKNGLHIQSIQGDIVKIVLENNLDISFSEMKDISISFYSNDYYNDINNIYIVYSLYNKDIGTYSYVDSEYLKYKIDNKIIYVFKNNINNNDIIKKIEVIYISNGYSYIGELFLTLNNNYINNGMIVKYNDEIICYGNEIINKKNDKYIIDYIRGYVKINYNNKVYKLNIPMNYVKISMIVTNRYGQMDCVVSNLLFEKYYDEKNNKINDFARYIEIDGEIYD